MLVNATMNGRRFLWTLVPCAVVLSLAAGLRGAEYDEQYTLFLTSGVPRPEWPATVFPAGTVQHIQAGRAGLAAIARDLRSTDVHPPLYFWLVSLWRAVLGHGLFVARLLSVVLGLGALALTGEIARLARLPPVWAMLLTMGCYGFTYTSVVARGFALAQMLVLSGVVGLLLGRRPRHFAVAGALFGAATLTNYRSVFAAAACLLEVGLEACWPRLYHPVPDGSNDLVAPCHRARRRSLAGSPMDAQARPGHDVEEALQFNNLPHFIEIVKSVASRNGHGRRTCRLHSQIVHGMMQECHKCRVTIACPCCHV